MPEDSLPWSVEAKAPNIHLIRIPYQERSEWAQSVLLSSDRHHDNPKTDWDLEEKHLKEARARRAPIVDAGDLFCAMQGKWDKRASKKNLRPEHQTACYLDTLVTTAAEFYGPYRDLFAVIGRGNHDQAIKSRHETDLTARLAESLGCHAGGYRGFVRFLFEREGGGSRKSVTLFYSHGSGSGGAVTKGVIKTNRRAVYLPDAEIVLSGHVHESWIVEIPRYRLTQGHQFRLDTQYHVQSPTYKNEFLLDKGGEEWVDEMEMPPKPIGAWWLNFYYEKNREEATNRIRFKFERAD